VLGVLQQFRRWGLRFGVVAPPAAKRTAFQEDGGAQARAVVQGEGADLEDYTFHQPRNSSSEHLAPTDGVETETAIRKKSTRKISPGVSKRSG
jgi:hypothetical protein